MAMMLKVCDMQERNLGGDPRYRYIAGRIDEMTRIVLMPSREPGAKEGDWVLYIAPDANPPKGDAVAERELPY